MDPQVMTNLRSTISGEIDQRIATHQQIIASWNDPNQRPFAPGKQPLNLLADGDSWFDYPVPFGVDIVHYLSMQGAPKPEILSLAHYGDATSVLMGLPKRQKLQDVLQDPDNGAFDALLFSGGGDDVAGDQFCLLLQDYLQGAPASAGLDPARVGDIFGIVEGAYLDLFALYKKACDKNAKPCVILVHAYDFAYPSGIGVCNQGPWLKPSLDYRGWVDPALAKEVVRQLLLQFDGLMRRLVARAGQMQCQVIYVQTQGTLQTQDEWANELHPKNPGFAQFGGKFFAMLQKQFPGRI